MVFRLGIAALMALATYSLWSGVATAADHEISGPIEQTISVLDSAGQIHLLQPQASEPARVFVFLTGECPISTSYVPLLNRLHSGWSGKGRSDKGEIRLQAIWADPTTTPTDVARFAKEYEISFPILLDRDGELARRFKPTHVPEAFVLDAQGRVAYRGRIDDTYARLGVRRVEPTENTLADAATAVRNGQAVVKARSEPVGCLLETPTDARPAEAKIAYTRDVAPILFANCLVCHREGEVGPFTLATYHDAAKRAKQIARVVKERLMPPWKAAEMHGEFEGQRTLTARQIETLQVWASGDRAEGNPADLPAMPQFPTGWRLGPPDLVLEMQAEFEVPAEGADLFQNFVIPIDIPEDKLVAVVDFIPGNPRVVHHSLLFLDGNHAGRQLDEKTPEPGYASFGNPGFMPTGSIGGWSPGKTPRRLPNGLGRYLKQGSDLVMQIHYHPTGKREVDRSKVGVYFVEKPQNVAVDIWASTFAHDIAPAEKDYRLSASYTLPSEVLMLGVVPHMHLLGRELRATAVLPDGTQRSLIHVPQWNFNWQDDYRFAQPFTLPKGTRLEVTASYDNSADNPANPSSPPKRVTWGEGTTDEMLYCFFFVATDDRSTLIPLVTDVLTREITAKAAARLRKLTQ
jgi:hypothetical protein